MNSNVVLDLFKLMKNIWLLVQKDDKGNKQAINNVEVENKKIK